MIKLGVGLMSLSFAYSITNIFMMVLLAVTYCRRKELAPYGIFKFLLKAALCVAVMGVVVFFVDGFFPARGGKLMQLGIVGVKLVIGVIVYFGMAALLRMQEATEWINRFKSKIFKKKAAKQA